MEEDPLPPPSPAPAAEGEEVAKAGVCVCPLPPPEVKERPGEKVPAPASPPPLLLCTQEGVEDTLVEEEMVAKAGEEVGVTPPEDDPE